MKQHRDLARRDPRLAEQHGDAVQHRTLRRLVRGEKLARPAVAAALQDHVGEGAADVGGEANRGHHAVCYSVMASPNRAECESLDARDPLARTVAEFAPGEPGWLYFDANSIGAMPNGAHRALGAWRRNGGACAAAAGATPTG